MEATLPVTLEDLYKGTTKRLKITRRVADPANPNQLKTEEVRHCSAGPCLNPHCSALPDARAWTWLDQSRRPSRANLTTCQRPLVQLQPQATAKFLAHDRAQG